MSKKATRDKTVSFFRLVASGPSGDTTVKNTDWGEAIRAWADANKTVKERTIEDISYDPDLGLRLPAISMHQPVSKDYASFVDVDANTIEDARSNVPPKDGGLAHSAVVAFLGERNIFAYGDGNRAAPGASEVERVADLLVPLDYGLKWKMMPVFEPEMRRKLEESEGVVGATVHFQTRPYLADPDEDPGIFSTVDSFARSVESEVQVNLSLKLLPTGRQSSKSRRKFREQILKAADRLAGGKKAEIIVSDDGVSEDVVNLIATRFTRKVEIVPDPTQEGQFSQLKELVVDTLIKNRDELLATF